jgi:hypothetical protein
VKPASRLLCTWSLSNSVDKSSHFLTICGQPLDKKNSSSHHAAHLLSHPASTPALPKRLVHRFPSLPISPPELELKIQRLPICYRPASPHFFSPHSHPLSLSLTSKNQVEKSHDRWRNHIAKIRESASMGLRHQNGPANNFGSNQSHTHIAQASGGHMTNNHVRQEVLD